MLSLGISNITKRDTHVSEKNRTSCSDMSSRAYANSWQNSIKAAAAAFSMTSSKLMWVGNTNKFFWKIQARKWPLSFIISWWISIKLNIKKNRFCILILQNMTEKFKSVKLQLKNILIANKEHICCRFW